LAGCEAAWQLAARGVEVDLHEMRPERETEAHQTQDLAELVCSNSFRSAEHTAAVGLLKDELRSRGDRRDRDLAPHPPDPRGSA